MALSPTSSRAAALPTNWSTSGGGLAIDASGITGGALGVADIDASGAGNVLLAEAAAAVADASLPSIKMTDPSSPGETVWGYGRQTFIVSSFSPAAGSSVFKVTLGGGETGNVCILGTTRFMGDGTIVINQHAAPADADLSAGDCAIWFDQTNGAAKLMMKAKQADGTVKTGSVNVQT